MRKSAVMDKRIEKLRAYMNDPAATPAEKESAKNLIEKLTANPSPATDKEFANFVGMSGCFRIFYPNRGVHYPYTAISITSV